MITLWRRCGTPNSSARTMKSDGCDRLLQAGLAVLDTDRTQFVVMVTAGAERGQILHQHFEDQVGSRPSTTACP